MAEETLRVFDSNQRRAVLERKFWRTVSGSLSTRTSLKIGFNSLLFIQRILSMHGLPPFALKFSGFRLRKLRYHLRHCVVIVLCSEFISYYQSYAPCL